MPLYPPLLPRRISGSILEDGYEKAKRSSPGRKSYPSVLNIPVPEEKLTLFREKLGLDDETLSRLDPYREVFTRKKRAFADHLCAFFVEIPETNLILEYETTTPLMIGIWANWFESLFKARFDGRFLAYLWRIGLRHVEINLDQRFSNLGFSVIRQYCHRIIEEDVPHADRLAVTNTVDRLIDFCLLVETSAYIDATTRCDVEIIKGIADRVRNPVTVIGGNIKRLQKKADAGSPTYGVLETLVSENKRLENMVTDVKTYFEMFERTAATEVLTLDDVIISALEQIRSAGAGDTERVEMHISPAASLVKGDPRDIGAMFYQILRNSLEAAAPEKAVIRVTSRPDASPSKAVLVEIFNNGVPISGVDTEKLFAPFYSTKPSGTGFGLPIVRLALRKNHGRLTLRPAGTEGTETIITLPAPEHC